RQRLGSRAGARRRYAGVRGMPVRLHRRRLALFVVGALVPLGALADPFSVVVAPSPATWRDRVSVAVSGATIDCGEHLGQPELRQTGSGAFAIDIPVEGACGVPTGALVPFEHSADLGHLALGAY